MSRRGHHRYLTDEEKNLKPKITTQLLWRIAGLLKPYGKQLVLVTITILFSSILRLLPTILTGKIIDQGLIGKDFNRLTYLIIISLIVTLLANLIGVFESYVTTWISEHVTLDLKNEMYQHLQTMSQRFFTNNRQGEIITRITSDISGVQRTISTTMTDILSNILTLVIALVAMYQRNWILASFGLIMLPLFILPTRKAGKVRWNLTRQVQDLQDETNSILNETMSVSGQLLVKLFGQEQREASHYATVNTQSLDLNVKENMAGRWFRVALSTFSSIGPMLIYLIGGYLMIHQGANLSLGDITVMVSLLGRMYGPVNSLLNIQVEWIRSMALFTRIFEYLDLPIEIKEPTDPQTLKKFKGQLEFDHVDFGYHKKQILKDLNFKINHGKSLALVGPSGAGKSSLVNLIPRLYDVTNGSIKLDGIDIRNIPLNELRQQIGVVTQDTYLFQGTIKDNLLYAKEDASQAEIEMACKKANIHHFIENLEEGYDTLVGNRGLRLSGGEKQRISIARVILKNPSILIFDEATSSLDSVSESLIQEAMYQVMKDKTTILIAHRLSTIQNADEILVLEHGEIKERGIHQDLLNKQGLYYKLWKTQSFKSSSKNIPQI